jgi:hypothetical protein
MQPLLIALILASQTPKPIPVVSPPKMAKISYSRDIVDILDAKCVGCHSSALAENKLKMEDVAGMLKGGKKGPAIVVGKADESLLFKMAAHRVEPVMPPKDKKGVSPLTGEELGKLKAWIDAGAKDDSDADESPAKPITLGQLPPGIHSINALDLSPDGTRLAVGRANVVTVFNLGDGQELVNLGGHKDLIQSIRFSADGSRLFAGGHGEVIVWNVPKAAEAPKDDKATKAVKPASKEAEKTKTETPKTPASAKSPAQWTESARIGPHVFRVLGLDISPDGKRLATAGGEPSKSGEIKIWSLPDDKLVQSIDGLHTDTVFSIRFSPEGTKLLTGSADKFVKIFNLADGKEWKSFEGHTNHVLAVDWKPDGKQIVSVGADGAAKFWDVQSGEQLRTTQGAMKALTSVRWQEPPARVVTTCADGTARDINASNAQVGRTYSTNTNPPDYLYCVTTSTDGSKVIAGGAEGVVYIWNGTNGSLIRKIEPKK